MIKVVSAKIEDYSLTYNEYIEDIAEYLEKINESETEESPKDIVKNMCNHLIEKYGIEEVRSEQD